VLSGERVSIHIDRFHRESLLKHEID